LTDSAVEALTEPLLAWLGPRLPDGDLELTRLERAAAGQSNDTVLCDVAVAGRTERLVVRRQAAGPTIFRDPDVIREAMVLHGLAGTAVPVPRVRWIERDPSVLGAPFFVMEQVQGRVPLGKPSIHAVGWLPTLTARERRRLWESSLDTLVAVHGVDWRKGHVFLLDGDAEPPSVASQVDALVGWYRWSAADREFPVTDAAVDYVVRRAACVETGDPVLVWGDARVGNMIFGDDHTVAAAIDWETATIGPAGRDVAHWLFFDEFQTDAVGIEALAGWPDRAATIARYEAGSGRRLGDLQFFDIMDELFMATTLIRQADARVTRGLASPETRMGHDNTVTQMLARRLDLPVPELSPDYVAHRGGSDPRRTT
jgi:aminoglycoside phosphotransferase (APT) family kinase protein